MEPKVFWTTVLAWMSCSLVWWLCVTYGSWWVMPAAIALVCLSFTVALVQDVRNIK